MAWQYCFCQLFYSYVIHSFILTINENFLIFDVRLKQCLYYCSQWHTKAICYFSSITNQTYNIQFYLDGKFVEIIYHFLSSRGTQRINICFHIYLLPEFFNILKIQKCIYRYIKYINAYKSYMTNALSSIIEYQRNRLEECYFN